MKVYLICFIFMFTALSCKKENSVNRVQTKPQSPNVSKVTNATLSSVNIINNQIVINGTGFEHVSNVKVQGASFNEDFEIESKSATSLVLNSLRNINFSLSDVFSLILSDAHGAATFQIGFTLQNGSVTAAMLHDMGAGDGDILVYNNSTSTWETRPLGGIDYKGTWNPTTNTSPNLTDGGGTPVPANGDYYLVSNADSSTTVDGIGTWAAGDWVVFNGTAWQKISSSTNITTFNGRVGAVVPATNDYTWAQINKTTSDINDIANVNTTGATNGQILTFNAGSWTSGNAPAPATNSVGTTQITDGSVDTADLAAGSVDGTIIAANAVTTTQINDGSITDADLAGSISQAKITNLTTDLAGKAPTPVSCTGSNKLQWNGTAFTCVADIDTTIPDTNTNAQTICAAGQVLIGDGTCVNTSTFGGDLRSDGSIAMTGNLNLNNQSIINGGHASLRGTTSTALTGTVTVGAGTTAVVGVGTTFTTELSPGDAIRIAGETRTVASIADNLNLTLTANHVAGGAGVAATKDGNILTVQGGASNDLFKVTGSGAVIGAGQNIGELRVNGSDDQTSLVISNTAAGRASLILDASDGDVVGNDYLWIRQNDDLTSDIQNTASAGALHLGAGGNRLVEINAGGNVGVGVLNPGEKLDVNGRVRATEFVGSGALLTGIVTTTGADNFTFQAGDRNIAIATSGTGVGGNLGVKAGDAQVGATDINGGNLSLSSGGSTGTGSSGISFSTATAGATGATSNAPSVKMTLTGAGFLGVGTAAPEESIHTTGALRVHGAKAGTDAGLILSDEGAYRRIESFAEPLIINENEQNIAIGHTTPTAQLHISNKLASTVKPQLYIENNIANESATATLEGNTTTIDSSVAYIRGKNNNDILASINFTTAASLDDGKIKFYTYDSGISREAAVIDNNGRLGVGLTTPEQGIHSQSSLTDNIIVSDVKSNVAGHDPLFVMRHETHMTFGMGIDTSDSNKFKIASGSNWNNLGTNAQLVIDPANNNVGIGTNSPLEKLEISRTDGNANNMRFTNSDTGLLTTDGVYIGLGSDESFNLLNKENTNFTIGTNNLERLRITGNGNFGFGTNNPVNKFDIKGSITVATNPSNNTEIPTRAALRVQANSDSTFSTFFGSTDGEKQFLQVQNSAGNDVSGHDLLLQPFSGNVGIGKTNPVDVLDVDGDIRVGTGTTGCVKDADGTQIAGTCSSDRRFKKDIEPMRSIASKLQKITPKYYFWRTDEFPHKGFGEEKQLGLIAQEVLDVFPELVKRDSDNYLRVDYSKLNLYVLQAYNEQYREVSSLKEEVKSLKETNQEMKKVLCELAPQASFCLK